MHGYLPYPRSPPPAILYLPPNRTQSSSPPTTAYTLASTRLQKPLSPPTIPPPLRQKKLAFLKQHTTLGSVVGVTWGLPHLPQEPAKFAADVIPI